MNRATVNPTQWRSGLISLTERELHQQNAEAATFPKTWWKEGNNVEKQNVNCFLQDTVCSLYVDVRDWGKKNLLFIADSLAAAISLQVYFCKVTAKGMNTFWTLRIFYILIHNCSKQKRIGPTYRLFYFSVYKLNKERKKKYTLWDTSAYT